MKQEKLLVNRVFSLLLLITMSFCSSSFFVRAQGTGTKENPYVFENGGTYEVTAYKSIYGTFTAPSDGVLAIDKFNFKVYADASFDESKLAETQNTFNGNFANKVYTLDCVAGSTYYIGTDFAWEDCVFNVTFSNGAIPLELVETSPAVGSIFDISQGIGLVFNQSVVIAGATMTVGAAVEESINVYAHGAYASIDVKTRLIELYNNGSLNEGDDIKFKLTGVAPSAAAEELYNGTGILELAYKAGAKPAMLIGSTNTPVGDPASDKFYSYYMSGDATGIVTLTFSEEVNMTEGNAPFATISYGSNESEDAGEFYIEKLGVQNLGGNILMVNLKEKLRRAKDMVTSGTNYGSISLRISNVRDMNGNYACAEGTGMLGSYEFLYTFEEVTYSVEADWETEKVITGDTKNLEVWLSEEGGNAEFSGAEFKYISNGIEHSKVVNLREMTITVEGNEKTIVIPMPNISADAGSEITVAFRDVERPDGLTLDTDPAAMNKFKGTFTTTGLTASTLDIVSAVWNNGEEEVNMIDGNIGVLSAGTTSIIKTSKDSEAGYVTLEVAGPEEAPENGYVTYTYKYGPFDEGIVFNWHGESLYKGFDYTFTLKAWKSETDKNAGAEPTVGEVSFIVHGAKEAYVYSDVVLNTDISDVYTLTSKEENTKMLEFSAPVSMSAIVNTGNGTSLDCTVEKVDENGTVWNVLIPESILDSYEMFDVNVFAKDAEGKAVCKTANGLGNVTLSEENTWFTLTFAADFNKPDFSVEPADGSEVESISTLTFIYVPAIAQNWGCFEKIKIYNRNTREIIGEFTGDDIQLDWDDYSKATLTLPEPITDAGTYVVDIPSGFFMLGEDMLSSTSRQMTVTYTIPGKGGDEPMNVTVDPEAGNVQEIPALLVVTFNDYETVGNLSDPTLIDDKGTVYKVHFEWGIGWNQLNVVLDNGPITTGGTYTLTIPAGAVELGDATLVNTKDIVFIYIVGPNSIENFVADEGGKVTVYSVDGTLLFRDADTAAVKTLAGGLYIINGKKVVIR